MTDRKMVFGASQKSMAVFHAAQKHSTRVRILKTALPIAAVAVAAVFSWFTFFAAPSAAVKIQLDPSENGKLVMTAPQLNGYTKENRPFSMTASRAVQDVKQSGVIMLEGIDAQMPIGEKDDATIDATSGTYDSVNGKLQFDREFIVKTTSGMEARLQSADVDISTGQMQTDKPVAIRTDNAVISADGMSMGDHGKVLVFEKKVKLTIVPAEADPISRVINEG